MIPRAPKRTGCEGRVEFAVRAANGRAIRVSGRDLIDMFIGSTRELDAAFSARQDEGVER